MMREVRLTTVAAALLALAIGAGTGTAHGALVGYWSFDAGSAADLSANHNDGVVGSAVVFTAQTPFGTGQAVQGNHASTSVITVPDSPSMESLSDQLTISFWMKADAAANDNWFRIFQKGTEAQYQQSWMVNRYSNTSGMNMRVDTNLEPGNLSGFNQNIAYTDNTTILDDQWHHLVFIMDNGQWRKYVDGVPKGSGTYTHNHGFSNDRPLYMLGRFGSGQYTGLLDDVAVWNQPLSTSQVQSITAGASPLNTPLVSVWRFEDPADPGKDSAATGNDLAAQGDAHVTAQGRFGGGLALDGAGDFLNSTVFPKGIPIDDSSYTIAAWLKPDVTGNRGIIGWGDYGTTLEVNALRLNGGNGFRHYWWSADLDADAGTLGINLSDGQWHHIAATYDGTTRTLWLDGLFLASDTPPDHLAAASNFTIGSTFFTEYFDGTLDDVAVFSAALSQTQIQRIMAGDFLPFAVGIPEPCSIVLLGLGAFCLAGYGRRRRRNPQRA